MKSKRAEEFINNSSEVVDGQWRMVDASTARRAVDLAEQDADEEITRYRTELEESKKREELARKVIDDQRKEMEKLKERAVEAYRTQHCRHYTDPCVWAIRNKCPDTCAYLQDFIQKLNER